LFEEEMITWKTMPLQNDAITNSIIISLLDGINHHLTLGSIYRKFQTDFVFIAASQSTKKEIAMTWDGKGIPLD
jgi:hypothetical protein